MNLMCFPGLTAEILKAIRFFNNSYIAFKLFFRIHLSKRGKTWIQKVSYFFFQLEESMSHSTILKRLITK